MAAREGGGLHGQHCFWELFRRPAGSTYDALCHSRSTTGLRLGPVFVVASQNFTAALPDFTVERAQLGFQQATEKAVEEECK